MKLAARLCEQAADGEILVDVATADLLDERHDKHALAAQALPNLNGMSDPITGVVFPEPPAGSR